MPRPRKGLLHVGIKDHVLALDLDPDVEVWRTKLEGVRMRTQAFVHLQRDANALYASYSGEIFCLDPATGAVRWHNQLTGLGDRDREHAERAWQRHQRRRAGDAVRAGASEPGVPAVGGHMTAGHPVRRWRCGCRACCRSPSASPSPHVQAAGRPATLSARPAPTSPLRLATRVAW